jgi:hypothetical protein
MSSRQLAQILRTYGQRVLNGDKTVYADMERIMKEYWVARNDAPLRQRVEKAFATRDFSEALKQYRRWGDEGRNSIPSAWRFVSITPEDPFTISSPAPHAIYG